MPGISNYRCDRCGFHLASGWGGHRYVIDRDGTRVRCLHPGELATIQQVLGADPSPELVRQRTGFMSDCVCLDCLERCSLDLDRDARRCPRCAELRRGKQRTDDRFVEVEAGAKQVFVSEAIKPVVATADTKAMAAGGPGLPREFVWRGETLGIAAVLRTWREAGPCTHGSPERYVRKHWFEVETTSHRKAKIYFERQARSRKRMQRWWLFSIEDGEHKD